MNELKPHAASLTVISALENIKRRRKIRHAERASVSSKVGRESLTIILRMGEKEPRPYVWEDHSARTGEFLRSLKPEPA